MINNGIQKGDNTHNHDQSITWVSFKIINVSSKSVGNPTEVACFLAIIVRF